MTGLSRAARAAIVRLIGGPPVELFGSLASPYVRKVRVAAIELAVMDRIGFTIVDPHAGPDRLGKVNPLHKVPTLIADDGRVLLDSPVIAAWLDHTFGPKLIPPQAPGRWAVLTVEALADGLLDAGTSVRQERLRPPAEQSPGWIDKQMAKVFRTLDRLEADRAWRSGDGIDLGRIAVGCAIGWLEFRMPQEKVLAGRPELGAWYTAFAARPSMRQTAPE